MEEIKSLKTTDKILVKTDSGWVKDENGIIMIQYQLKEESAGYYPRSFEDAFICINKDFIINNDFSSLKNEDIITDFPDDYYQIADKCIDSKPSFAIEILLNSDEKYSNWNIPKYIKEGLEWLRN